MKKYYELHLNHEKKHAKKIKDQLLEKSKPVPNSYYDKNGKLHFKSSCELKGS